MCHSVLCRIKSGDMEEKSWKCDWQPLMDNKAIP